MQTLFCMADGIRAESPVVRQAIISQILHPLIVAGYRVRHLQQYWLKLVRENNSLTSPSVSFITCPRFAFLSTAVSRTRVFRSALFRSDAQSGTYHALRAPTHPCSAGSDSSRITRHNGAHRGLSGCPAYSSYRKGFTSRQRNC
jgi:hypothetical protein